MLIVSPVVKVTTAADRVASVTSSVVSVTGRGGLAAQSEVVQFWQLVTAHDCGLIQVGDRAGGAQHVCGYVPPLLVYVRVERVYV